MDNLRIILTAMRDDCEYSAFDIAKGAELNVRSVRRALSSLRKSGLIEMRKDDKDKRNRLYKSKQIGMSLYCKS